ncbi:MAG TPA: zf-HC2 domain-containing protein [Gemmatimonadaceae bacterium]|jgi:anti-sigma factor (TIGR02949 family)|nr:zf-HC2 domain-containing protein [Gemmatimonadaceae bacterium]
MTSSRIPPLPPECMEVLTHVWDFLDEQLTPETTDRLTTHLKNCPQCFGYQSFQEQFLDALATLGDRPGAPPALRERVLSVLREQGFAR